MIKLKNILLENANPYIKNFRKKLDLLFRKYQREEDRLKKNKLWRLYTIWDSQYQKIKNLDPHEIEKNHFLKSQYTGHIRSDAYERYESDEGLSWLGNKNKYPELLSIEKHGLYEVEYRRKQNEELLKYVKINKHGGVERDDSGNVMYMSPEEIDVEKLPKTDTTIVAFIDNKPIGLASNEFGAVGIWVEKKYQNLGIGLSLLQQHIELRPDVMSKRRNIGQMTDAGVALTSAYYDYMVKKHGKNWWYYLNQ